MRVRKKSKILSIEQECEDNKMIDLKKKYIEIYLCIHYGAKNGWKKKNKRRI